MPRVPNTGRVVSSARASSSQRVFGAGRVSESPFLNIPSTVLWIRPDAHLIVQDSSSRVQYAQDQSPLNWSGNQPVSGSRPTVVNTAAFNNRPAFLFDGINDFLYHGLLTKSASFTISVVFAKVNWATTNKTLVGANASSGSSVGCWAGLSCETANELTYVFSNGTNSRNAKRTTGAGFTNNTAYVVTTTYTNGNSDQVVWVNGVLQTLTLVASGGNTFVGGSNLGFSTGRLGEYAAANYWDGPIAEVFMANTALTPDQVRANDLYLGSYYNIQII